MRRVVALVAALVASAIFSSPATLGAQDEVPSLRWRTIETAHFRIHYEPGLEAWAQQLASRIEGVRTAVAARVGYTPPQIIDILVEDPLNQPNGSAWPSLAFPTMRFWATPPAPTSAIGNSRGWGDILSIHEYAHLAHLLRPSRKPLSFATAVFRVLPTGPLVLAPSWVSEGYATLIEGELTGSGRPNGTMRPAIIRTLALEGYLPTYPSLDQTGRFNGGAMRYLIGSAYLEWLQSMRGDSSLPQLWRRATARSGRNFPTAFTETFGEAPDVLYGRFSAEVTRRAFAVKAELEAQGLAQGELVQHWTYGVGSPDVAPDGSRIALRRSFATSAGGIYVFSLRPDTAAPRRDSMALARRLKRDSEDLAAYRPQPRALKSLAFLGPVSGEPYDAPRFMSDGERVLVTRNVSLKDGRMRADVFVWNHKTGKVRRVTRGAGIQQADPTPDGTQAAGLTCGSGSCSVVMVDLSSGAVRTLAAGTLDGGYAGVRVSPNGRYVATARQQGTRWVPVLIEIANGSARDVGPADAASRFSPAWENDSTLIVASDASGVLMLERLPLNGGERTVAVRTIGSAASPEIGPDGRIWWLDLHGRGWDLRVNPAQSSLPLAAPISDENFPASRRVATQLAVNVPLAAVNSAERYGSGPMGYSFLALTTFAADAGTWSAGLSYGDPVGRGSGIIMGGAGERGAWSGARANYTWRGLRPSLTVDGFIAEYLPSKQPRNVGIGWETADERYTGAVLSLALNRNSVHGASNYRLGYSMGAQENPTLDVDNGTRRVAFAAFGGSYLFTPRPRSNVIARYEATFSAGSSNDAGWTRSTVDATLGMGNALGGVNIRVRGGEAELNTPANEQFRVGGTGSPYVDRLVVTHRVEHLGLPYGIVAGRRYGMLTAETQGPLRIYHDWIVGGNDEFGETQRVAGLELSAVIPRVSVLRVPASLVRVGASHTLNGRVRNATFGYIALTLTQ